MAIVYFEALLKHVAPRTFAVFAAPVEGDVSLLRYQPASRSEQPCLATERDGTICLRVERSGSQDTEWKSVYEETRICVEEALEHIADQVAAFNAAVTGATPPPVPSPNLVVDVGAAT